MASCIEIYVHVRACAHKHVPCASLKGKPAPRQMCTRSEHVWQLQSATCYHERAHAPALHESSKGARAGANVNSRARDRDRPQQT